MKPIELLKQHCTFDSPYYIYVLFGISRKKYNECTGGQEKVFREVIKNSEDIEKKYWRLRNSILAYRDEDGKQRTFYMYVSVNARDTRKAFFHLQRVFIQTNEELSKGVDKSMTLNRLDKYWMSSLMRPLSRADKGRFLFDIDTKDSQKMEWIRNNIAAYSPDFLEQETKNGFHIVTQPFDKRSMLNKNYDWFEIKKDSLLFVEWFVANDRGPIHMIVG